MRLTDWFHHVLSGNFLLAFVSTVIFGSGPLRTCSHIFLDFLLSCLSGWLAGWEIAADHCQHSHSWFHAPQDS
jgi:hypothetical protein